MRPDEFEAAAAPMHAACDAAWAKVEAAAAALNAPHTPDERRRLIAALHAAHEAHEQAVQKLARLTTQLLQAVEVSK